MTGPPPIRTDVYYESAANDELRGARLADKARILFIILYRFGLISGGTAASYVVSKWQLQQFGQRHANRC